MTLDYTYSELDFEKDTSSFGIWFENPTAEATVNERGSVISVTQLGGRVLCRQVGGADAGDQDQAPGLAGQLLHDRRQPQLLEAHDLVGDHPEGAGEV